MAAGGIELDERAGNKAEQCAPLEGLQRKLEAMHFLPVSNDPDGCYQRTMGLFTSKLPEQSSKRWSTLEAFSADRVEARLIRAVDLVGSVYGKSRIVKQNMGKSHHTSN